MVTLRQFQKKERFDIVVVPFSASNDYLNGHVNRSELDRHNLKTCLVIDGTDDPCDEKLALDLFFESLATTVLSETIGGDEPRLPIPHHLFKSVKCKDFEYGGVSGRHNNPGTPAGSQLDGDFRFRLIKINGRADAVIKMLEDNYERLNNANRLMIQDFFNHVSEMEKFYNGKHREYVFLVHHFNVSKKSLASRVQK